MSDDLTSKQSAAEDVPVITDERASAAWNSLPLETRMLLVANWRHAHIRHLEREKQRLKCSYDRNVREINETIKNIREAIIRGY